MSRVLICLMGLLWALEPGGSPAPAQVPESTVRDRMLAAEDRRAPDERALATLTAALKDDDPAIQRIGVRALGRLERPALVSVLAPMLASPDAAVRAEAANAIAQAVSGLTRSAGTAPSTSVSSTAVGEAESLLAGRLERETDPDVRGVVCESLGRLPYTTRAQARVVETLLVAATYAPGAASARARSDGSTPVLLGAVKGLEALLRQTAKFFEPAPATSNRLRELVRVRTDAPGSRAGEDSGKFDPAQRIRARSDAAGEGDRARVRRLALMALAPHSAADIATLASAMDDEQWEARRLAVRGAGAGLRAASGDDRSARLALVMRGLGDPHWRVRYEALSSFGRAQDAPDCRVLLTAIADPDIHVSLLAVDLVPACGAQSEAPRVLGALVRGLPAAGGAWHRPTHALVSLARLAPDQAVAQLPRFMASVTWQVRVYAARAAAVARAGEALRTLAADADDNVRTAAVSGLSEVERHAADDVFISQFSRSDPQLLMTAARALEGSTEREPALSALVGALAALTARHRDTSRDARLALLDRIEELGTREEAPRLEPYVDDFDPRVARAAAALLRQWTGNAPRLPVPGPPAAPPPTLMQLRQLDGARAIVRMKGGGTFTLALLTDQAPASVVRFVTLARQGYYNGLTFHRVEPSLIQGGSPGANEYSGDGPFMRDELGLVSNRRGTVGISTRGRDTGDAQWYVNLVDNARYDHNYTVFAAVEDGMAVVDAILEGDVIDEVRIVGAAASSVQP